MLASLQVLLAAARAGGYAVGAFNVYNLEGVRAVIGAAEALRSPVILQVHPSALAHGGTPLLALCREAAQQAAVPVAVHLDHATSASAIREALAAGVTSVMADGSHLAYADNLAFTREAVALARAHGAGVEAELGRLSGTEDGLSVPEYAACLTDPAQAAEFVAGTGVDALAVCIGNVHGTYRGEPRLDMARLAAIRQAVPVPLVLHGASGLPAALIAQAIALGVCKFNVNTEVRAAYLAALREGLQAAPSAELLPLLQRAVAAMQAVVADKLRLFGSAGKA
ncbi:MAG: tagatose-bisphosphate aldolase [Candidatus Tectimicrobiota bacterium]|nr:MAG: tagatose-bisphosphate aldolase [Candidatus Tectomicrobia bacterium]